MRSSFITAFLLLSAPLAANLCQAMTENEALLMQSVRADDAMLPGGDTDAAAASMAHAMTYGYGFKDRKMPQIVFFGDSITAFGFETGSSEYIQRVLKVGPEYKGWVVKLNDTLQQQAYLHNLAFKAGTNTRGFNQSLPLVLDQIKAVAQDVALVNIGFGANGRWAAVLRAVGASAAS
jgi:lysophospholipase L1-like esterase